MDNFMIYCSHNKPCCENMLEPIGNFIRSLQSWWHGKTFWFKSLEI